MKAVPCQSIFGFVRGVKKLKMGRGGSMSGLRRGGSCEYAFKTWNLWHSGVRDSDLKLIQQQGRPWESLGVLG